MQYKSVSPVGDRVFVKVDTSEATSQGGILLPTSAQKKPTQGEIVGLGDVKSLKVKLLCKINVQGNALGAEHVQRTRLLRRFIGGGQWRPQRVPQRVPLRLLEIERMPPQCMTNSQARLCEGRRKESVIWPGRCIAVKSVIR